MVNWDRWFIYDDYNVRVVAVDNDSKIEVHYQVAGHYQLIRALS